MLTTEEVQDFINKDVPRLAEGLDKREPEKGVAETCFRSESFFTNSPIGFLENYKTAMDEIKEKIDFIRLSGGSISVQKVILVSGCKLGEYHFLACIVR